MEQLIAVILLLSYIIYVLGREKNFVNLSERLDELHKRRPERHKISSREYLKKVKERSNERYWEQKRLAADQNGLRKIFYNFNY